MELTGNSGAKLRTAGVDRMLADLLQGYDRE